MVMLLLPASSASSTYASCQDESVGSVVLANDQVAVGVEAAGGAVDPAVREIDGDSPAGGVGRRASEELQDVVGRKPGERVDRGEERVEEVVRVVLAVGGEPERGGFELGRERGLVQIDADARDGFAVDQLDENA